LKDIRDRIDAARDEAGYRNYLEVRERVLAMLKESAGSEADPSRYWSEELEGFDYLFDASPLIIRKLREHCYHITGLRSYDYRGHHRHQAGAFETKLKALRAIDRRGLFVPESPVLGGFGHVIDGCRVNIDTLKFYESLIAMDKAGLIDLLERAPEGDPPVVVEIGAGWGGFAYQLKTIVPRLTYVIVDLPQTLLFSGTYLKTAFPEARMFIYGDAPLPRLGAELPRYDFVLLPHYVFDRVDLKPLDLGINMVSFQEMTDGQIEGYLRRLTELKCPVFYSHNRDRSRHNTELSAVGILLKRFYRLEEIEVLPVSYTNLALPSPAPPAASGLISSPSERLRRLLFRGLKAPIAARVMKKSLHEYRHLVGRAPEAA
jgi:hypothetical protein